VFLKNLSVGCIFLVLAGSATSNDALPSRVMQGHLKILSPKPVDLGDENAATVTAENYADYPLLILSRGKKKKSRGLLRTRTETIALRCRRVIMFWTCKTAHVNVSAPSRNGSRLSRIRPYASIWISWGPRVPVQNDQ